MKHFISEFSDSSVRPDSPWVSRKYCNHHMSTRGNVLNTCYIFANKQILAQGNKKIANQQILALGYSSTSYYFTLSNQPHHLLNTVLWQPLKFNGQGTSAKRLLIQWSAMPGKYSSSSNKSVSKQRHQLPQAVSASRTLVSWSRIGIWNELGPQSSFSKFLALTLNSFWVRKYFPSVFCSV